LVKGLLIGEKMQKTEQEGRFEMIKARHKATYQTALLQGKVDEQMRELCSFIAGTKGFYTSSCCSGRIMLLEKRGEKKKENFFHRKWHREITKEELLEGFKEKIKGELWFKVEPFILHIGCKTLEDANKILSAMKKAGVKRGGIMIAQKEKFLIELQGTASIGLPIKKAEKELVTEQYLTHSVLGKANTFISNNYKRLKKLEEELSKDLE